LEGGYTRLGRVSFAASIVLNAASFEGFAMLRLTCSS
jgi:hypothetical protein